MEFEKIGISEKEKGLLSLALKAHADPHSVTDGDFERLRDAGVSDQEIVETIEVTNFGDSINRFCDTLEIGPDVFLTYATPAEKNP
jgi:alkylhydroperoxidase family enzyme